MKEGTDEQVSERHTTAMRPREQLEWYPPSSGAATTPLLVLDCKPSG